MFIVGIDVAKRSHEVCMITSDGQTVQRPFSIRNNCTGYNLMLEKIRKHTNIKSQIVFAMESTAHYWLALFTRLRKDGYHVILRLPTTPDDEVSYVSENEYRTLRYYAAVNQYNTLVGSWIDETDVQWKDGFDKLDIPALLKK